MKKFGLFLIAVFMIVLMCGCIDKTNAGSKDYDQHTNMIQINLRQNLYYDTDTNIVYIVFNEWIGYNGYGYMSPYYAPNGLPYLYDVETNYLIEIEK